MLCSFYENHLKLYNELKYHILYDNAKITNKIKDKKKHVKIYVLFVSMFGIAVTKILNGFTYCKDTAKFDRCKKNEKNFTKSTCRHPFARLATVSRAPVGFPPHPPSLSLVFRFFHSSAYARVFLSLFSLIGVILFCPISPLLLFFLIRVTTISFSFFFS